MEPPRPDGEGEFTITGKWSPSENGIGIEISYKFCGSVNPERFYDGDVFIVITDIPDKSIIWSSLKFLPYRKEYSAVLTCCS